MLCRFASLALVILASSLLLACQADNNKEPNATSNTAKDTLSHNKVGNSAGNLNNSGIAAIQGNWIYYINDNDGYSIYKIHTAGSGQTKLNDDSSSSINVVGDWIYYNVAEGPRKFGEIIDTDWKFNIFKMRTDGSNQTRLNDDISFDLTVVEDWIYYRRLFYNDSGSLDADFTR